jgi:hypothetical protein
MCLEPAAGATVIVEDQWTPRIADFGVREGAAVRRGYGRRFSDGMHVGHNYSRREAFLGDGRNRVFVLVDGPQGNSRGPASPPDLIKIVTIS